MAAAEGATEEDILPEVGVTVVEELRSADSGSGAGEVAVESVGEGSFVADWVAQKDKMVLAEAAEDWAVVERVLAVLADTAIAGVAFAAIGGGAIVAGSGAEGDLIVFGFQAAGGAEVGIVTVTVAEV